MHPNFIHFILFIHNFRNIYRPRKSRKKNKKGNNIYHRKTHNVQHKSVCTPTPTERPKNISFTVSVTFIFRLCSMFPLIQCLRLPLPFELRGSYWQDYINYMPRYPFCNLPLLICFKSGGKWKYEKLLKNSLRRFLRDFSRILVIVPKLWVSRKRN